MLEKGAGDREGEGRVFFNTAAAGIKRSIQILRERKAFRVVNLTALLLLLLLFCRRYSLPFSVIGLRPLDVALRRRTFANLTLRNPSTDRLDNFTVFGVTFPLPQTDIAFSVFRDKKGTHTHTHSRDVYGGEILFCFLNGVDIFASVNVKVFKPSLTPGFPWERLRYILRDLDGRVRPGMRKFLSSSTLPINP